MRETGFPRIQVSAWFRLSAARQATVITDGEELQPPIRILRRVQRNDAAAAGRLSQGLPFSPPVVGRRLLHGVQRTGRDDKVGLGLSLPIAA